jgi:hypothetical protein
MSAAAAVLAAAPSRQEQRASWPDHLHSLRPSAAACPAAAGRPWTVALILSAGGTPRTPKANFDLLLYCRGDAKRKLLIRCRGLVFSDVSNHFEPLSKRIRGAHAVSDLALAVETGLRRRHDWPASQPQARRGFLPAAETTHPRASPQWARRRHGAHCTAACTADASCPRGECGGC